MMKLDAAIDQYRLCAFGSESKATLVIDANADHVARDTVM